MTTFALIAGMLPVALGSGEGAQFRSPLGVAVIGGVITSTVLTLVAIPTFYEMLTEWRGALLARLGRLAGTAPAPVPRRSPDHEPLAPAPGGHAVTAPTVPEKKKVGLQSAWRESRELLYRHRRRLALGMGLMLVSRFAGLVLPPVPSTWWTTSSSAASTTCSSPWPAGRCWPR